MERKYNYDDAHPAAEALRETSAAREEAAREVLNGAGVDGLSTEELKAPCGQLGVKPSYRGREHGAGGRTAT